MNKQIASVIVVWFCLIASVAAQTSPYTGVWHGTTGQNFPIYFRIADDGRIDSLTIRVRMNFVTFTCTATFNKDTTLAIRGDSLAQRVALPSAVSNIRTWVRGSLTSPTTAQGTYDRYSGTYFIICGSILGVGSGTPISQGTWQATKSSAVSVSDSREEVPEGFQLYQNYPNPFNPSTTIRYHIPRHSHVRLTVFNVFGKVVGTLVDKVQHAGSHQLEWTPSLPSGTYFYRMQAANWSSVKKLVLLK